MDSEKFEELKGILEHCKQNPSVLHTPPLSFFKNYLQSVGAEIPSPGKDDEVHQDHHDDNINEDIIESDVELDNSDVVEPENDPPSEMGDPSIEITEENEEVAQLSKAKSMEAIADGKFDEAIYHLTRATISNPKSAILYANRASIFIKIKKPNAAIRDADAAIKINPDSAKGYKARGMARAMLGLWEEAVRDLHVASNLDLDDEISLTLKKVEPNANKLEEHRRKYERLRKEKESRKIEVERQHRQVKEDAKIASVFKDGEVIVVPSARELKIKLDAASKTSRLAVLYFTATWCGPCRYISPAVSTLAGKYPKVVFMKLDVDDAVDAAGEWKVSSIPSFFLLKNGKEIDKFIGVDSKSLEKMIIKYAC